MNEPGCQGDRRTRRIPHARVRSSSAILRLLGWFVIVLSLAGAQRAGAATPLTTYLVRGERLQTAQPTAVPEADLHVFTVQAPLRGPSNIERSDGVRTAIPRGTRLTEFVLLEGVAFVRMTDRFSTGDRGRSAVMRRTQLVYTLTTFPDVRAVRILVGEEPCPPRERTRPPRS
jgi:spore germination protein GerM